MRIPRGDARTYLAFGITISAVVGIIMLGIAVVATATDKANATQSVLNSVLPLFGTWVGTVLAYYFSRENFEAASASTQRLVRELSPEERLRATRVSEVMNTGVYSAAEDDKVTVKVEDLNAKDYKRLPVLDSEKILVALLDREDLKDYLVSIPSEQRAEKTIRNLIDEQPEFKRPATFIDKLATLAEARDALVEVEKAKVIFVTENGDESEPIIGMLTNTDIARHASNL